MYKKYTVPSCKRVTLNNKKRNTKLVVVLKEKILYATVWFRSLEILDQKNSLMFYHNHQWQSLFKVTINHDGFPKPNPKFPGSVILYSYINLQTPKSIRHFSKSNYSPEWGYWRLVQVHLVSTVPFLDKVIHHTEGQ